MPVSQLQLPGGGYQLPVLLLLALFRLPRMLCLSANCNSQLVYNTLLQTHPGELEMLCLSAYCNSQPVYNTLLLTHSGELEMLHL